MAPFGVKVLSVVTGVIRTNLMANVPSVKLPPNSYYSPAEKQIAERAEGVDVKSKMKPEVFASRVVDDILAGSTGKIWRGLMATVTRLISTYMPTFLVVCSPCCPSLNNVN
jgi:1-acylglycerone phosphate reductase